MVIYVGYDSREDIAYQVCKHSCRDYPVIPIVQQQLRNQQLYWRDIDTLASTEFSITRFLVPHLNAFKGWALFVDCDTLFLTDPSGLFALADDRYAVMCVKHEYTPSSIIKMDGKNQHIYPRKNWSSVMLFNCSHPSNAKLTKELVNTATPQFLHRLSWLKDEEIGSLPISWNWLVDWYKEPKDGIPKLLHYTEGGPWFIEHATCEYANIWLAAATSIKD
jgi:lipopolysaccharide biosynthesis glycosyltransferase